MGNLYKKIISLNNLLSSWKEFRNGKRNKADVQEFELNLEDNLFELHEELTSFKYKHSNYSSFHITDPKQRHIHKAKVRDRIVHHAVHRILYPIFDEYFISGSYSCRLGKGSHRAVTELQIMARKVSKNYTGPCYVLKCDIKKFFNSVDHQILNKILKNKIDNSELLSLLEEIIGSFGSVAGAQPQLQLFDFRSENRERERAAPVGVAGKGIPIGNLTSQLFANVYLNEFDQFIKHNIRIKYYLRYCDDFVILSNNKDQLEKVIVVIEEFLNENLELCLHDDKVCIRKLKQGIDFLGYVILPYHTVLRTKTRRRMLKKLTLENSSSYLGILGHCDSYKLRKQICNIVDNLE